MRVRPNAVALLVEACTTVFGVKQGTPDYSGWAKPSADRVKVKVSKERAGKPAPSLKHPRVIISHQVEQPYQV